MFFVGIVKKDFNSSSKTSFARAYNLVSFSSRTEHLPKKSSNFAFNRGLNSHGKSLLYFSIQLTLSQDAFPDHLIQHRNKDKSFLASILSSLLQVQIHASSVFLFSLFYHTMSEIENFLTRQLRFVEKVKRN